MSKNIITQFDTKAISFLVKIKVSEITQTEMHKAMAQLMPLENVVSVVPFLDDTTMNEMIQGIQGGGHEGI